MFGFFQGSRRGPEGGPDWLVTWTPPSSAPWPQKMRGPGGSLLDTFILLRPSLPAPDFSGFPQIQETLLLPNQELEEEMRGFRNRKENNTMITNRAWENPATCSIQFHRELLIC